MLRFNDYLCLTEPSPRVLNVLYSIAGWSISDRLVFSVLAALAQMGEEFVVVCSGDYDCEVSSKDHLEDVVPEETKKWVLELCREN